MAKKSIRTYFRVRGNSGFPLDMLRYDACYPLCESDSARVFDSIYARDGVVREVELVHRSIDSEARFEPTHARWESFSWYVIEGSVKRCY